VPRAAKHIFVRVTVFYLLSLFIVGLIVPSNDPKLLASTGNAASSPFIIAAENAGVKVLPSIVNAVIITSAWSSGNHGILQGSRSLYALALENKAPKVFRRVTRFGIPWVAVCFQSLFMLLAFMTLNTDANTVFGWLQNLTAASTLAVWITIGICSLRVRQAMKKQGISADRLPWAAPFQPYIAHFAIWANSIVLLTGGFYVFVSPIPLDIKSCLPGYPLTGFRKLEYLRFLLKLLHHPAMDRPLHWLQDHFQDKDRPPRQGPRRQLHRHRRREPGATAAQEAGDRRLVRPFLVGLGCLWRAKRQKKRSAVMQNCMD